MSQNKGCYWCYKFFRTYLVSNIKLPIGDFRATNFGDTFEGHLQSWVQCLESRYFYYPVPSTHFAGIVERWIMYLWKWKTSIYLILLFLFKACIILRHFLYKTMGFKSWSSCNSCNWNQRPLEFGNPFRTRQFRLCKMMKILYIYDYFHIFAVVSTFVCLGLLVRTMKPCPSKQVGTLGHVAATEKWLELSCCISISIKAVAFIGQFNWRVSIIDVTKFKKLASLASMCTSTNGFFE